MKRSVEELKLKKLFIVFMLEKNKKIERKFLCVMEEGKRFSSTQWNFHCCVSFNRNIPFPLSFFYFHISFLLCKYSQLPWYPTHFLSFFLPLFLLSFFSFILLSNLNTMHYTTLYVPYKSCTYLTNPPFWIPNWQPSAW